MSILHGRWRRRISLLAAGVLDPGQAASTLRHADGCPSCQEDLASLRRVLDLVARDPVRAAEPAVPLPALLARVQARLDEGVRPGGLSARKGLWAVAAAAGVAFGLFTLRRAEEPRPAPSASPPIVLSDDALRRLERTVAREQAVRYLNEAQGVLMTVAATPASCHRKRERVDVGEEARKSRELLARRALLVEMDRAEVASARHVLEDVENILREVASLEACARPRDLQAINQEISKRRLLMKIDLATRELQG